MRFFHRSRYVGPFAERLGQRIAMLVAYLAMILDAVIGLLTLGTVRSDFHERWIFSLFVDRLASGLFGCRGIADAD